MSASWARFISSIGAVANIWTMMTANLFGFCLGEEGTLALFKAIGGSFEAMCYLVVCSMILFVKTQLMFEVRDCERRRGLDVKF